MIIEIDGEIHDRFGYDEERTEIFKSYGLSVIRFKNEDVISRFDIVCYRINEACFGLST